MHPSDVYWYRAFGEEFGPVSLDTIEELLRDGVLCETDEVRCGREGEWERLVAEAGDLSSQVGTATGTVPAAADPDRAEQSRILSGESEEIRRAALESMAVLRERHAGRHVQRQRSRGRARRVPQFLRTLRTAGSGTAVLVSLAVRQCIVAVAALFRRRSVRSTAVVVLVLIGCWIGTERWYSRSGTLEALQSLSREAGTLRQREAAESEWREFSERALRERERLLPPLESAATADDRASLELLWAARDALPTVLERSAAGDESALQRFDAHLEQAQRHLLLREKPGSIESTLTALVIGVDVVLVGAIAAWLLRTRRYGAGVNSSAC